MKRQQWNATAAGLALLGGVLTAIPSLRPLSTCEKWVGFAIVVLIPVVCTIWIYGLQLHLKKVRQELKPHDDNPLYRGWPVLLAFVAALSIGAGIVTYALLRNPPPQFVFL